jgi:capsular polysaccharide biosynthesis protein
MVPGLALTIQLLQMRAAPFRAEFRAVVVLPGDKEIPGSSERPELMIMDDVPQLVSSTLFAERVVAQMESSGTVISVDAVMSALSSTRYARTVTVVVRDDDRERAVDLARAAEVVFAESVNEVLVAPAGSGATITIIDPVDGARRGDPDQWRVALIVTAAMGLVGVLGALVINGLRGRVGPAA